MNDYDDPNVDDDVDRDDLNPNSPANQERNARLLARAIRGRARNSEPTRLALTDPQFTDWTS